MNESENMSTETDIPLNRASKKIILPKLRTASTANGNSSITEYLEKLRSEKMKSVNNPSKCANSSVVDCLTNLRINDDFTEKKESGAVSYDFDLTNALIPPGTYKPAETVEIAPKEVIDFSKFFVDCDRALEPEKGMSTPILPLISEKDITEIRRYESDLLAKDCSMFAKVACVRFRPYNIPPASDFRAFVRPESAVVLFDFKSASPDEEDSKIGPFMYKTMWSNKKI